VTDRDQRTAIFSLNGDDGPPERLEAFDDFAPVEERPPSALATGLVSVGFIVAAIKRTAPFWCAVALFGLLVGVGIAVKYPPSQQAETSVLITYGPDENPSSAVFDNQAIAESRTVAARAMQKLGLQEGVGSFTKTITVAIVTDSVLQITVSAPTGDEAVSRANAVAAAFLQFRAAQMETAQRELLNSLEHEVSQAKQTVASINSQIRLLSAQPPSPAQASRLKNLRSQLDQAAGQVNVDEQTVQDTKASTGTLSAVTGSVVLDPGVALVHSRTKSLLTYAVYGLVVGLALGLGIVVIRAIVSNRLRRRDDVARAVGAPVKLSVGAVKLSRWRSGRRRLAVARRIEVRRIAAHLRGAVPARTRGPAAMAVVPVDDPRVAALSLASLALSRAREGLNVVLADLAGGAPAATLLDNKASGVRLVNVLDTHLILAVPERDDIAPVGPLGRAPAEAQRSGFTEAVSNACGSADLLLTLVTLDPSRGGENLATWATSAVVMVTAGRSSWAKINAVGELIRLAGTSVTSAVLVGADKTDESLGVTQHPGILAGTGDPG
jgi:capsular polysaccharide biosynthesis protein